VSKTCFTSFASLLGFMLLLFIGPAAADQSHVVVTVAPGAHSEAITVPGPYLPVALVCANKVAGNAGLGNASLLRSGVLNWTSYDFATRVITTGTTTASAIRHIVFCDAQGSVDVESVSGTQIWINNASAITAVVDVMFIF
jgi:hypothetical protein